MFISSKISNTRNALVGLLPHSIPCSADRPWNDVVNRHDMPVGSHGLSIVVKHADWQMNS